MYHEIKRDKASTAEASRGWLEMFIRRHGLSLRQRASVAQKDPDRLINRIVSYLTEAPRLQRKLNIAPSNIYAMNGTAVWEDIVATTVENVGTKKVLIRSTGHEKARVTVCLSAQVDASKLRTFIVLRGSSERQQDRTMNLGADVLLHHLPMTGWTMNCCCSTIRAFSVRFHLANDFKRQRHSINRLCWLKVKGFRSIHQTKGLYEACASTRCLMEQTIYSQAEPVLWQLAFDRWNSSSHWRWQWNRQCDKQLWNESSMHGPTGIIQLSWISSACRLNLTADGNEHCLIHCFKDGLSCHADLQIF